MDEQLKQLHNDLDYIMAQELLEQAKHMLRLALWVIPIRCPEFNWAQASELHSRISEYLDRLDDAESE